MKRNYGRKNRTKGMQIIENVCAHFNTTLDDLCGSNKMPSLNIYRQIAFYLLHEEADYTSKDAVAAFGMTSSSEAGRGIKRIQTMIQHDYKGKREIIVAFFREYGYCRELWEGKEAA
jgi:chromosomal replication initiation ATPase DnaA